MEIAEKEREKREVGGIKGTERKFPLVVRYKWKQVPRILDQPKKGGGELKSPDSVGGFHILDVSWKKRPNNKSKVKYKKGAMLLSFYDTCASK